MVNINISITEDAYKFLKNLKGRDKSFSEVIIEMKENGCYRKGSKEGILRLAGVLKDVDWKKKEKRMKEFREEFNERINETEKYMHKKK